MEKESIISKIVSTSQSATVVGEKSMNALHSYKEVYGLIERTYIAMGKRKSYEYTSQSSSNGNINTKSVSSTSKI